MRSRTLVLLLAALCGISLLLVLMSDDSNNGDRRQGSRLDACGEEEANPPHADAANDKSDESSSKTADQSSEGDSPSKQNESRIVVSGTLRYEDGSPVPGAVLLLSGDRTTTAVTASDGRFEISSAAAKTGNHDLMMKGVGDYDSIAISRVRLKVDVPKTIEVTITRGLEWSGVVLAEETRKPILAVVVLNRGGAAMAKGWQGSTCIAICNKSGRFRFNHVPASPYTASIRAKGYQSRTMQLGESSFESPAEILLGAASKLQVKLKGIAPAWTKIPLLITIRSTKADGRLDGKFHEAHHRRGEGPWTIPVPPPGRYEVEIRSPKHREFPRLSRSLEVATETPAPMEFEIDEGIRVVGSVSLPDGTAVPSARVRWGPNDAEAKTNENGRFEFPHVPNGSGTMQIWNGVFWVGLGAFEIPRSGQLETRLRTHGTGTIRGRCEVDGKPPSASIRLMLRGPDGKLLGSGFTKRDGTFALQWLSAGRYMVSINPASGGPVMREILVDAHGERVMDTIALAAFPSLPVVIEKNPADLVVPDRISVIVLPDGHLGWIHKTKSGTWTLEGVPEGTHSVLIRGDGIETERHSITVRTGQVEPVRIRLRAQE